MKTFMDYLDTSGDGVLQENEFVTIDVYIDILEEEEGLAGWAIALIIITCLIIACLIGYIIAVCCCGVANCFAYCCACCCKGNRSSSTTHKEKVIYDDRSRSTSRRTRMLAIEDRPREDRTRVLAIEDRPREEKKKDVILMIKNKEDNRSMLAIADGMEESIKSRNNRNMMLALENGKQQAGRDFHESLDTLYSPLPPVHKKKKMGRDPTLYIAGDEDKPDPEEALMLTNDVTYKDGPSLKVKRDPTMYYEGRRTSKSGLPAMFEKQGVEDLPLKPPLKPGATRGVFENHLPVESEANMRASNASFYYGESYYSDVHTEDPTIVSILEPSRQLNRYKIKMSKKLGQEEEYDSNK